jgi:hypothetical protein
VGDNRDAAMTPLDAALGAGKAEPRGLMAAPGFVTLTGKETRHPSNKSDG